MTTPQAALVEAARAALRELDAIRPQNMGAHVYNAREALRAALAQAEAAQPVAKTAADYRVLIREDFEQRMRAEGHTPAALTRLGSGIYVSPAVQQAWEAEKRKYAAPQLAEAAPKQEAVADERAAFKAWFAGFQDVSADFAWEAWQARAALAAQPRQPAPLSEEVLLDLYNQHSRYQIEGITLSGWVRYARAVEAAHGVVQP